MVVTNPPRWRFPRWEYSGLEILHGGVGGDVELGARTSEHILVFAFDPLISLTLSLLFVQSIIHLFISYCLHLFLALIHIAYPYMLGLLVCASLVLNHESFIQHLNAYLGESRGVSPEPFMGNSATLGGCIKCVAIRFF